MVQCSDQTTPKRARLSSNRAVDVPAFPLMPRCFGWTKIEKPFLQSIGFDELPWRWALVYEWVEMECSQDEEAQNTITAKHIATAQELLDYFYIMGFNYKSWNPINWINGRLIDFSEVEAWNHPCWRADAIRKREAEREIIWRT